MPPDITLSPAQVGHLLAITNEAMSNIARHAMATKVVMRAEVKEGLLIFEIEDNGRGFPSDLVLGYGLNNMRERTQLLGGVMHLYSRPHEGTRLHIEILLENNHETNTNLIGR